MNSELNLRKKSEEIMINSAVSKIKLPSRIIGGTLIFIWTITFISNGFLIEPVGLILMVILSSFFLSDKLHFFFFYFLLKSFELIIDRFEYSKPIIETTFKTDRIVIINTKTGEKKVYYQSGLLSLEFHEDNTNLNMTIVTQSRLRKVFLGYYASSLHYQYQLAKEIKDYSRIYYPDVNVIL